MASRTVRCIGAPAKGDGDGAVCRVEGPVCGCVGGGGGQGRQGVGCEQVERTMPPSGWAHNRSGNTLRGCSMSKRRAPWTTWQNGNLQPPCVSLLMPAVLTSPPSAIHAHTRPASPGRTPLHAMPCVHQPRGTAAPPCATTCHCPAKSRGSSSTQLLLQRARGPREVEGMPQD